MYKKILLIVFILAFVVRLWGVFPGYPNYHPDESQIYSRALLILLGKEEKLSYWGYPALIPLINAELYSTVFIPITFVIKFIQNPNIIFSRSSTFERFLQTYIFGKGELNALYWGRIISAIFGGLSVVMIFYIGKKYFGFLVGFLAALLLTFNPRHVLGSHFALPDVANGFFLLLPLIVSFEILQVSETKSYLWAGITSALSMSVKLSPFALLMPISAHVLSKSKIFTRQSVLKVILMFLVFVALVLLINIFHLFHLEALQADLKTLNHRYVTGSFRLLAFPYYYLFLEGIGTIVSIFSLLGILYGLLKFTKKALIALGPVILIFFALTFYSVGGVYVRNFTAVIPIILLFSAIGITQVFKANKIIGTLVLVASLTLSLRSVLNIDFGYSEAWNINKVKAYLSDNLAGDSISATAWFASYLSNSNIRFVDWKYESDFSLRELQEDNINYLLMDTDTVEPKTLWWMGVLGKNSFFTPPNDLLYSTFVGSASKELLAYRIKDFTKPIRVPETNFFLIKIPEKNKGSLQERIFFEDFNKNAHWQVKGTRGEKIANTLQVMDGDCLGCIKVGELTERDTNIKYLTNPNAFRTFRITSPVITVLQNSTYKVSADVWNSKTINKNERDGFIKIELYKKEVEAKAEKPGDLIFVSERHFGDSNFKTHPQITFPVPDGYSFMTVSFQVDKNKNGNYYFDNLTGYKLQTNSKDQVKTNFPDELLFVDSIL